MMSCAQASTWEPWLALRDPFLQEAQTAVRTEGRSHLYSRLLDVRGWYESTREERLCTATALWRVSPDSPRCGWQIATRGTRSDQKAVETDWHLATRICRSDLPAQCLQQLLTVFAFNKDDRLVEAGKAL